MTKIIAFCGVDGSGKTSIVDYLHEQDFFDRALYIKKTFSRNVSVIKNYHHRNYNSNKDWVTGSFAEAVSYASCLDFLQHYHSCIAPNIGAYDFLVCDRHALCFAAYHLAVGGSMNMSDLFEGVRVPDLYFFIDAPLSELENRYEKRGGASEDESVEVMHIYRESYMRLLKETKIPVVWIKNDGSLEEVFEKVTTALRGIYPGHMK
ncbi:dTMP kinase [Chitinophaga sp. 22321]|uniref:Thymidylate kinase-like domain-containing protein n=1 Tax=Chitinophaga hostae TaxID=2831022 RepID=A0ABS5J994_9BACT|nr:hypothetical protein [Chitinophaga hostae]MBS0031790.1 hypothetical protein [Chitinophaga hostae]